MNRAVGKSINLSQHIAHSKAFDEAFVFVSMLVPEPTLLKIRLEDKNVEYTTFLEHY